MLKLQYLVVSYSANGESVENDYITRSCNHRDTIIFNNLLSLNIQIIHAL